MVTSLDYVVELNMTCEHERKSKHWGKKAWKCTNVSDNNKKRREKAKRKGSLSDKELTTKTSSVQF